MREIRFQTTTGPIVSGRTVRGIIMRYGDTASGPGGRWQENMEPGALKLASHPIPLNIMHDRAALISSTAAGMDISQDDTEVRLAATLPETPRADQAIADIKAGLLVGLSVEMVNVRARWEGSTRVISSAQLVGVGLVDRPAYPESQLRWANALKIGRVGIRRVRVW